MVNRIRAAFITLIALGTAIAASAAITIDTTDPSSWIISNGVLTVHFYANGNGRINSIQWTAFPGVELIDQTNRDSHGAKGFYMDNAGLSGGTNTPSYYLDPNGNYIDFWETTLSPTLTYEQHYIMFVNDPGIHIYFVAKHGVGDGSISIGQIQWVFRGNLAQFVNTYDVNSGLQNLGARIVPESDLDFDTDTNHDRDVQDATYDLHGITDEPAGYRREFNTKYDYSNYEYLHRGQGVFGNTMAAWMVLPSSESLTGGPTKQDLIFTGNLLIMEAYSNHLDNQISFPIAQDQVLQRLYGPFYLHFNAFNGTNTTPQSLYLESQNAGAALQRLYDSETELLNSGYVPLTSRGEVQVSAAATKGMALNQAWAVLSDPNTNFQYSHAGWEYWVNFNPGGVANFHNVAPGTYRLSVYALGQFGELREDGITVTAGKLTKVSVNLVPENFGPAPPIWTIGTADRSSHEFLHGTITNPIDLDPNYSDEYTDRLGDSVQDDREYWGNWNYWQDFASTQGAVIYYATPVGWMAATNDLTKWNYNQWHVFHPGLYAGIYNPSDLSTDGYDYVCPAYVYALAGETYPGSPVVGSANPCRTTPVPDWQVHFTVTADQQAQGPYVVLSVALAATESDLTASLNGNSLTWTGVKYADAGVRSGFSGTYQWVVFEWPASLLKPGADNVITFHVDKTQGVMYDALRLEVTNTSAAHEVTGWNDYEYVNASTYEPANDNVANQQ